MTEAKAGHTEMAVAAVLKMRAKKMWASAMTAAVAKASPQMVDKLEPPLQELIKKHVLRKKLAHDVQKCFTPLQVTSCPMLVNAALSHVLPCCQHSADTEGLCWHLE